MLIGRVIKTSIDLRPAIAWLIFSCVLLCSVPLSAQQKFLSTDSVYCPLQRTWVKRYQPGIQERAFDNSLEEICAPLEHKRHFADDLVKSLFSVRIKRSQISQVQLFFRYLENGNQAFAEIAPFNSAPDRQLVKLAAKGKSGAANYRADFHQKAPEVFSLQALARPPTSTLINNKFDFQFARELKNISRNINPRSPPVSI